MPRVAAVSLELPWSSDELELICGLSSSDSSGLACQPQSSLGTRSTGAAIVARAARPLTSARTRELARGAGPLRHRWCFPVAGAAARGSQRAYGGHLHRGRQTLIRIKTSVIAGAPYAAWIGQMKPKQGVILTNHCNWAERSRCLKDSASMLAQAVGGSAASSDERVKCPVRRVARRLS